MDILELAHDLSRRQGDEPDLLEPSAARRRGGLRPCDGAGARPAAGPGADRRAQAGRTIVSSSSGSRAIRSPSPAGWRQRASRPTPIDDHLLVQLPEGASRRPLADGRESGEQVRALRPTAEHARRSFPQAPSRNNTDADPRPGISALEGPPPGHAWRWLAITRQGVRSQLKNRWVWGVILGVCLPAARALGVPVALGAFRAKVEPADAAPVPVSGSSRRAPGRTSRAIAPSSGHSPSTVSSMSSSSSPWSSCSWSGPT